MQAAHAGGDGDDVEELDGLVGEGAERLAGREHGDAAADVAGERFDFFQRGQLGFAGSGCGGEFFQIELGVSGDDCEKVLSVAGVGQQGFEDLLRGQVDFAGDGDGGEIVRVDFVGAQFVGDVEGVEEARGVGFLQCSASGTTWPPRSVRVVCASGRASSA